MFDEKSKIRFLGGGDEVGRLGMLMESGDVKFLFDYGMLPEKPPKYPLEAPPVDLTFLTHAHIDHSGMIPWIAAHHGTQVMATRPTMEVSSLLHQDTLKIADIEGYPAPYTKTDAKSAYHNFDEVRHKVPRDIATVEMRFHSAGHIPGATMFEMRGGRRMLFTGDLDTRNARLVWGAHPVKCDVLFMEATYSGRDHPERGEEEKRFIDTIDDTVSRGGVAVVPAFAVGRSQEVLLMLKDRGYNVWFDGMGKAISQIFLQNPEYLRSSKDLERALRDVKEVHSGHGRKLALKDDVIVTTSGMLDGGPVLWYLEHLRDDPKSSILTTGYQVSGTNGARLRDTGTIDFYGDIKKVECQVDSFDFSAHAGHKDLVSFAKECAPEKVVLMHGDKPTALASDISDFAEVIMPKNGEEFIV
ncbi:MAG: MBL fold metallo-hydrolase [Thermoplasmata archaeon HGW-Thermoplasmata-1]|nr:MAG: MBL fold metallo-hydrolase [Thermoplasmata archaeon HGW-Thermoplasmata-1]